MNGIDLSQLRAFDPHTGDLNVIVETSKGNRNKFKYDEKRGLFKLNKVLPAGAVFPFDFGFLPSTRAEDGDPLDVLVLMDEPAFAGCLLPARLIGVIEAEQTDQDGKAERNDRLIAVAAGSHTHQGVKTLDDLDSTFVDQIEHFFVSYNAMEKKQFRPLARRGPGPAQTLVREGIKRHGG